MKQMKTLIMVIFGGSGDLTKRKLMPALYLLFSRILPFWEWPEQNIQTKVTGNILKKI